MRQRWGGLVAAAAVMAGLAGSAAPGAAQETTLTVWSHFADHEGAQLLPRGRGAVRERKSGRRPDAIARGIAAVRLDVEDADLERLHAAGFRGTRLHLVDSGGSVPLAALEAGAAKVAPLGWHVQIYARPEVITAALPRLRALPTPVVIDHLGQIDPSAGQGQPGFKAMLRLLESGRAWVKLCAHRCDCEGAPFLRAVPFVHALDAAAPERLVWGTDSPHPNLRERPGRFRA